MAPHAEPAGASLILRASAAHLAELNPDAVFAGIPFKGKVANELLADKQVLRKVHAEAAALTAVLKSIELSPSYAIGALAEAHAAGPARRARGVFYTDPRLAEFIIQQAVAAELWHRGPILDPAVGGGVFLVAATRLSGSPEKGKAQFVAEHVYGLDLAPEAADATLSSLLVEAGDVNAMRSASEHVLVADSLLMGRPGSDGPWSRVFPSVMAEGGFGYVLGNPPWEKVKLHAHEYLVLAGREVGAYGSRFEVTSDSLVELESRRRTLKAYLEVLGRAGFELQNGGGDADLYKYFVELAIHLIRPGGVVALLVPGGLIRSQGAEPIRQRLLETSSNLTFTVFDNRRRFFPIDTRFKFLACIAENGKGPKRGVTIGRGVLEGGRIQLGGGTTLKSSVVRRFDRGAGIPEIFSDSERDLFGHCLSVARSSTKDWGGHLIREVDMTFDKKSFRPNATATSLPVIEGRMVHQFTHAAKAYNSGSGRSAVWERTKSCRIKPQFHFPIEKARPVALQAVRGYRAGFCDVTGQTNERTLLAALIPEGVICGNKVPTVAFSDDLLLFAWLGFMNSFVVDWIARKVTTTSVNFFVLQSLPLPGPSSEVARVAGIARQLSACRHFEPSNEVSDAWDRASLRAALDIAVARSFGLGPEELSLIVSSFPLIDRSGRPLRGESRSTITHDFLFAQHFEPGTERHATLTERVSSARASGAVPYWPTD